VTEVGHQTTGATGPNERLGSLAQDAPRTRPVEPTICSAENRLTARSRQLKATFPGYHARPGRSVSDFAGFNVPTRGNRNR
jgi:hypothetical protein